MAGDVDPGPPDARREEHVMGAEENGPLGGSDYEFSEAGERTGADEEPSVCLLRSSLPPVTPALERIILYETRTVCDTLAPTASGNRHDCAVLLTPYRLSAAEVLYSRCGQRRVQVQAAQD